LRYFFFYRPEITTGRLARNQGVLLIGRGPKPNLFPNHQSEFLSNVQEHLLHAAAGLGLSISVLRHIVTPKRQVHTRFQYRRDNGSWSEPTDAWRVGLAEPSKGGIRAVPNVTEGDVVALDVDMDYKLPLSVPVEGLPLRGVKGGSPVDLTTHSTAEKVRWMRGWVASQMDYFADEVNRWLLAHADEVLPWLDRKDPKLAQSLRILQRNAVTERVYFDEEGSQLELPYVERILKLRSSGTLPSLRLLACVTGKTAPNSNLPHGRGGIRGRTEATGKGLAFAVRRWWQLNGFIGKDQETLDGKSAAIEGFGNVGYWAAVSFITLKAKVSAIAEYDAKRKESNVLYSRNGLSIDALDAMKAYETAHGTLIGFEHIAAAAYFHIERITKDDFWALPVDITLPSATENTITPEVARIIRARFVGEGANGPTTADGDRILIQRGIGRLPDVVANSGGVFTSYFEMLQDIEENAEPWTIEVVDKKLRRIIEARVDEVYGHSEARSIDLRRAVLELTLQTACPRSSEFPTYAPRRPDPLSAARWTKRSNEKS
jgi:glutamate dehydrogenase